MQKQSVYISVSLVTGFLIYCFVVFPLRNSFDDRWPYINVFLNSPGGAANTVAMMVGLYLAFSYVRKGNQLAKLFCIAFTLILFAGLLESLYAAWLMDHRHELDSLIFKHPLRLAMWKWHSRIDTFQCIAAMGTALLVVATTRSLRETVSRATDTGSTSGL